MLHTAAAAAADSSSSRVLFLFFSAAAAFLKLAFRCSPPSPVSYDKYLKSCPPRHLRLSREHRRCRKMVEKKKKRRNRVVISDFPAPRHSDIQTSPLYKLPVYHVPPLSSRLETRDPLRAWLRARREEEEAKHCQTTKVRDAFNSVLPLFTRTGFYRPRAGVNSVVFWVVGHLSNYLGGAQLPRTQAPSLGGMTHAVPFRCESGREPAMMLLRRKEDVVSKERQRQSRRRASLPHAPSLHTLFLHKLSNTCTICCLASFLFRSFTTATKPT